MQGRTICRSCRVRLECNPQRCPRCGDVGVLAFLAADGSALCARCAGERPTFCCDECGSEDTPYGARCARCVLRQRATELLNDPASGQIHARLVPLFAALMAAERPQSTIYWLRRTPGDGPRLLGAMARGEVEISHRTFEQLPRTKGLDYLRDLLAALGILPPYEPRIERMTPWLEDLMETLPPEHAALVERFARWRVLRHLRQKAERDELTKGVTQRARSGIRGAVALLAWLEDHSVTITTAAPGDIEHYLAISRPGTADEIYQFVEWARQSGLNPTLEVAIAPSASSAVTMTDVERWRHVERLLHDTTIRHYTRIGGLFVLLFAQPLSRICRMRKTQVDIGGDGRVFVTFESSPVEMPEVLDALIEEHLSRRGQASYASRDTQWLFPGGTPGNHLGTENFRKELVALGMAPHSSKHAALFDLAATLPHPILADLLGISSTLRSGGQHCRHGPGANTSPLGALRTKRPLALTKASPRAQANRQGPPSQVHQVLFARTTSARRARAAAGSRSSLARRCRPRR